MINARATLLDSNIIENQRTDVTDAQYATIENLTINCTTEAGDIDDDSAFTNADVTAMIRYLSGFDVVGAKYTADVTKDAKINNRDAIALVQKMAGWN